MNFARALRVLAELSASQWGMVTTAQAVARGVTRLDLSRLAEDSQLVRLAHGVYRDAGAPADEFESLRAVWLSTDPSSLAEERLSDLIGGVVVSGASAASLHRVGDLPADRHEFSAPVRRQSQRPEIRYRQRRLDPGDVTIVNGLPVTTIEQTVADLVEARIDLSLVADALRDATRNRRLDLGRLEELLSPLAARHGFRKGDGQALLDRLMAIAGLDASSLAKEIASSETLGALVAANQLARRGFTEAVIGPATREALRAINESVGRAIKQAMTPSLEKLAASVADSEAFSAFQADLSKLAEQVALAFPAQELLRSFGQECAAALGQIAVPRTDLLPAIEALEAAQGAGLVTARDWS